MDDKNVMLEIRAGTGGSEAGLFAGDLLEVYMKYGVSNDQMCLVVGYIRAFLS